MVVQRNLKKIEVPIKNLKVPVASDNTVPIQYRIVSEDGNKKSAWSNVINIPMPDVISGNTVLITNKAGATKKVSAAWEDDNNANVYDVFVHRFSSINLATRGYGTFRKITASVAEATLYDGQSASTNKMQHDLKVGMVVAIASTGSADFNIATTTVTEIIDPYTFRYSPTPTTSTTATQNTSSGTITLFGAQPNLAAKDYTYVDTTEKNDYNISKSYTIGTINESVSYSANIYTNGSIWVRVQVASSDRRGNDLLLVGQQWALITA